MAVVVCSGSRGTIVGEILAQMLTVVVLLVDHVEQTDFVAVDDVQAEEDILWRFTKCFNLC